MNRQQAREALYRDAIRAATVGLVINLMLGVVKLTGGLLGHSFALLSDAVNSLGDVVTSAVIVVALWFSQRPPDDEHPYGHSRAEGIAACNVALLVVLSALAIGWEALRRFGHAQDIPPTWTLAIAGSNVVVKEALYHYNVRVSRRTGSGAILANAWDHRSDALCSLAVLIGLGVVRWGGAAWSGADQVAALVVVVAIIWSASQVLASSVRELMDLQADEPFVRRVRATAGQVPGVRGVEKLWLRKSGLEYFADIHVEVDPDMTVAAGHEIGHAVKDRLLDEFPLMRDVLVHLEPTRSDS